jgi:uncharacterized membrane protein
MGIIRGKFDLDDIAQQIVGGLLVGGPFIVTEEVWGIASEMSILNVIITFFIVVVTGYTILYVAVLRDPEVEASVGGIVPLRFVSLILVSYVSSMIVALATGTPSFFARSTETVDIIWLTFKASTTVSIFTVIGAGTVDSVFGTPEKKDIED